MSDVEQEDLRRRLRAARVLADVTVAQLAELVPDNARLGERTLRKLEAGESVLTPPILRELAVALGVRYEWFTVPDLRLAVGGGDPDDRRRIESLESQMSEMWEWVRSGAAVERPGAARFVPPEEAGQTERAGRPRSPRRRK